LAKQSNIVLLFPRNVTVFSFLSGIGF
jgi:hypothetical protein